VEIDLAVLEEQAAAMEAEISSLALASDAQLMAGVKDPPSMSGAMRTKTRYLADLQRRRNRLKRVIRQRQTARRLFSLWHTIHIPLGLTLFTVAFVHIGAAIYYALLLK
jgi:hypothetical protein